MIKKLLIFILFFSYCLQAETIDNFKTLDNIIKNADSSFKNINVEYLIEKGFTIEKLIGSINMDFYSGYNIISDKWYYLEFDKQFNVEIIIIQSKNFSNKNNDDSCKVRTFMFNKNGDLIDIKRKLNYDPNEIYINYKTFETILKYPDTLRYYLTLKEDAKELWDEYKDYMINLIKKDFQNGFIVLEDEGPKKNKPLDPRAAYNQRNISHIHQIQFKSKVSDDILIMTFLKKDNEWIFGGLNHPVQ